MGVFTNCSIKSNEISRNDVSQTWPELTQCLRGNGPLMLALTDPGITWPKAQGTSILINQRRGTFLSFYGHEHVSRFTSWLDAVGMAISHKLASITAISNSIPSRLFTHEFLTRAWNSVDPFLTIVSTNVLSTTQCWSVVATSRRSFSRPSNLQDSFVFNAQLVNLLYTR